ncbi:unnamed protein product, partial [Timema podura]|nr:unnamed protein product [Timema podura]
SVAEPSNISNNSSLENISYGDKLCPQDKINYLESKLQIEKEKSDKITSDWFDFGVNSNTSYAGDEKHLSCNNGEVERNCAVSASDTVLKSSSKSQKLPGKTHSSPLFTKCVVKMDYILVMFVIRKFTINLQLGVILGIM